MGVFHTVFLTDTRLIFERPKYTIFVLCLKSSTAFLFL